METRKRWHFWAIVVVLFLTIYNILPTIFFYSHPLHSTIDKKQATQTAIRIADRVNDLESSTKEWIESFSALLKVKPSNIKIDQNSPEYVVVSFAKESEADKFRHYLPRAGSLITFTPSQLSLASSDPKSGPSVTVHRRIPIHFDSGKIEDFYQFTPITDEKGALTPLYQGIVEDRVLEIASVVAGVSQTAKLASAIVSHPQDPQTTELAIVLAQQMTEIASLFGDDSKIAARFYASLSQSNLPDRGRLSAKLLSSVSAIKDKIRIEKIALQKQTNVSDPLQSQRLDLLSSKEATLTEFEGLLRKWGPVFERGEAPWDYQTISLKLKNSFEEIVFDFRNPVFEKLVIDSKNGKLLLKLHPDLLQFRETLDKKNASHYLKDQVDQVIYNQVANLSRITSEKLSSFQGNYVISLQDLSDSKSLLAMRLSPLRNKPLFL